MVKFACILCAVFSLVTCFFYLKWQVVLAVVLQIKSRAVSCSAGKRGVEPKYMQTACEFACFSCKFTLAVFTV